MTTFTSQISRELAREYGHEALKIGENGKYTSPSGKSIDLRTMIENAVKETMSYPPSHSLPQSSTGAHKTIIEVTNETTLSAAARQIQQGYRAVALNFASATDPGGGFLSGARAQEEYLARSSCLYQCIRDNPMYHYHRDNYTPLYSDYILYSPDVPIIRADDGTLLEEPYPLSIITAAAVNAKRVSPQDRNRIQEVMRKRILKVLAVGFAHGHDAIVLGAWGCGAFGNKAEDIAVLFREALTQNFKGAYRQVAFAIVDWSAERRFIGPFENILVR